MLDHTTTLEKLVLVCGDEFELGENLGGLGVLVFIWSVEGVAESLLDVAWASVSHL